MSHDSGHKERLPDLTRQVVDTYTTVGRINHLGHAPLPSREAIVEIVEDLKDVLYPGYRRRQNLHPANVIYHVGDLLDGIYDRLSMQIARAIRHERRQESEHDAVPEAREKTFAFLETIPRLRELLALDAEAAYEGDPAAKGIDEIIFCYPGFEAVTVYRLAHELYRLQVPLIPRIMCECAHSKTGIDIHPGARIGRSFFIDHGTGVVIGETCEIADHVKLYQGVTLGALSFPKDQTGKLVRGQKRHPTIEEGVVIYASATILGGNTVIGHHAVIGSSVWLTRSVAPYTVVTLDNPSLRYRDASGATHAYEI